ncbi:sigma-70 family RNA polymerase sigma factor [Roseibacillus persicicus]|uniref:DNA-directed RNA polymerase sigma-70 factor n=1 Tax=Roseibacillus persicicus TaxID=454148 RepID=A0A918WFA5_9BACT|nr:sigma-70 family RNA polymerase sigma factor [Roseibacillus persicicus]MDQ8192363.1 sigma-70 family RNA polymerase sigma factor [Roseibacillus persicicus]GHC45830.1 DNA-directed RNA polymerase sigma-70 factor [Roseibacillus persicicus]
MKPSFQSNEEAVTHVQELFLKHIDEIRGFIRAFARNRPLADDVLQETFLTITAKADSFEPGTKFPQWARAIARFKILELSRRDTGRLSFLTEEAIEVLAGENEQPEWDENFEPLEECVEELPASMRKMIDLRYQAGRKPAAIAEQVGWKVEAVYVCLSRARNVLKDCIEGKTTKKA